MKSEGEEGRHFSRWATARKQHYARVGWRWMLVEEAVLALAFFL